MVTSFMADDKFKSMSDNQLIDLINSGDEKALEFIMDKYFDIVNIKASKFFATGVEKDDIIQEGMIGLYKATKSFDSSKQNSFKTFANLCIERQLISAIKSSNRQKHMPLNSYLSLNISAYNNDDENSGNSEIIDVLDTNVAEDPLDTITKKEYFSDVESVIEDSLSTFEKKVLSRYIQGDSYVKIAEKLDTPVKSIDNAIQRIRKKTIKNLNDK